MTEVLLAENKLLKDKLKFIKDKIEEYLEEPTDSLGFILELHDICEDKVCRTCKYWAVNEEVCTNADSDNVADFVLAEDTCPEWTDIGDKN